MSAILEKKGSFGDREFAKIRKRGSHLYYFDLKFEKTTFIFSISVCTARKALKDMENVSVMRKKVANFVPPKSAF